jgi:hypothetical protein
MKVLACPKCGTSKGVHQEHILGMGTGDLVCPNCNFIGPRGEWDTKESDFGMLADRESESN